jgi:chemotaxis protein MotB
MYPLIGIAAVFAAVIGGFLLERGNPYVLLLNERGLRPGQVVEVRGFADQRLFNPTHPEDPRNRRVSVVVKFSV